MSDTAIEALRHSEFPNSSDCISRQSAIDAVLRAEALVRAYGYRYAADAVRELSAVQPARLKGRWIERNPQNSDKCRLIECDQCGFSHIVGFNVPYEHWIEDRNFCERCGADMRGEQDG